MILATSLVHNQKRRALPVWPVFQTGLASFATCCLHNTRTIIHVIGHDFSTFWPSILSTGISHLVVCTIHLNWNKNNQRIIKDFAMQWMNAHNKRNLCQNMIKKVKGWNGIQRQICTAYILHTLDIIKWVHSLTVELVLVVCLVFRLRKVELLYDY